ncbi:MAG TPA: DHHA1 domain-containing protein [Pseudomonadota bacterium]|jgi:phosphoesterase RecJ-like protein|nr:DHHA1 domain-containing protein [Pseudomonadota bacterium]HNI60344.1 DHHA1 domain-containing protein [Pseudomonadota bacterium]HNN53071.1 DHHA1 domain-containing protein [Pseudomonadota bacterium]
MQFSLALSHAAQLIAQGQRFLIGAHSRLDGDALGSMLVSAHGLRQLGKEVYLYNPDPVPRRLAWLPGAQDVRRKVPGGVRFDATLIHDCGARHLLGDHFPDGKVTGPLIVLDHHEIVSDLGDVVLRDSTAGSAGVIAMRLLSELGVAENDLPTPLATALFVSLVEDTGWFRYPNSNPEVFRLAQVAIAAGVKTWEVALLLDEQLSEASLRLLALVLPTLERHCGGKLALLSLTDQMLRDAQATMDDVLKLVNYARALRGVWVGGQITVSDDRMYVSLRGKGEVHVGQLAARFGGGGHHNAAGCTIAFDDPKDVPTSLAKAKARLIAACEEVMGSGDA